ncbi:MAG: CHRD domain-containing protein [Phormidesmis sp.]
MTVLNTPNKLKALVFSTMAAVAATAVLPLSAIAAHLSTSTYTSDIGTLNSAFGSAATGSATFIETLNSEDNTASLNVKVDVTGLQDLTGFGIHVAHIHGQFAGNATRPLFDQGNGPFFEGTGGTPVNSVLPTLAKDDVDKDGYLNFIEGRPAYGPVVLNLSSEQQPASPSGLPPLTQFLQRAGAGEINPGELFPSGTEFKLDTTYNFDLNDADQARQFNNLGPLDFREIVIHGLTVPASISDPIDAAVTAAGSGAPLGVALDDGSVFRLTAPVAAGTIRRADATDVPEPVGMSLLGAAALAVSLGVTRRRTTA